MVEIETRLTEQELKNIEDYDNKERGIIVKSKTGNKFENSMYSKK